jgi:NADPH:quinone reductase-like Zn-dependent oxidoreductase
MRAIAIRDFGAKPELMDLPKPVPEKWDVLVAMRAAGLNPIDWKIADGMVRDKFPHRRFPMILGADGAGVVTAVGDGVTRFQPGAAVYGSFRRLFRGLGSYADYGLAYETDVANMPEGMTFAQAAAVPTASTTAVKMVKDALVAPGKLVLIVGATGGVGLSAVQLAADLDAHVIATAREDAVATVKSLGARETVDYTAGPLIEQVADLHPEGIDAIIDLISDPLTLSALSGLVRPGGAVVSAFDVAEAADPDRLADRGIRGVNVRVLSSAVMLRELSELVETGRLRILVESELPLEEAPNALERNRAGGARGKTVFKIG